MSGNLTKGYDGVIEVSLSQVRASLKTLLDEAHGTQIGDAVNAALSWALKELAYVCTIDELSFRVPDSLAGKVTHHSLFADDAYLKLSFNAFYAFLGHSVPLKITLETVIGVDVGPCVAAVPKLVFARLNLKYLIGYLRTAITLDQAGFPAAIQDILRALQMTAGDVVQRVVDEILEIAGTTHAALDGKIATALQNKVPYLPIPPVPLYLADPGASSPLALVEAECRARQTADGEQVLWYMLTYGGGTAGDRWAFDAMPRSDILPGNDAAIIVSFEPYICRIVTSALTTAFGLTGADADAFARSFRHCKLTAPVVISAKDNLRLTALAVQILPAGFAMPYGPKLEDGALLLTGTITKSGTCYGATGTLSTFIVLHRDEHNQVIVDQPQVLVDVDAGIDTWCQIGAAALGMILVPDPVIDVIVDAVIYKVMSSIVDAISRAAVGGVASTLTMALEAVTTTVPQIPGVEALLKRVTIDDVTMAYGLKLVARPKLAPAALVSPADGAHLAASDGSRTTLAWAPVAGATGYLVEALAGSPRTPGGPLAWSEAFTGVVEDTQVSFSFSSAKPGRWRVTALDATHQHASSAPAGWRSFSWAAALQPPSQTSPPEGEHFAGPPGTMCTMTLAWTAVPGATDYVVEVQYGNPDVNGAMIWNGACRPTVTGTALTFNFAGANAGRWRVSALDRTGGAAASPPGPWRSFSWAVKLPTPIVSSPAEGAHLEPHDGKRPTRLTWDPVAGSTGYLVEVEYGNAAGAGMVWSSAWHAEVATTQLTFDFVGANPGRWRVTALERTGQRWRSDPSAWRGFYYTM